MVDSRAAMTSSAHICYNSKRFSLTLSDIAKHLRENSSWHVSVTEWSGYGTVVPQLLVQTPIPFLIQIEDDPDWVPGEIQEIIEWEDLDPNSDIAQRIAQCDARLAVQSTTTDQVINDGSSITVSTLGTAIDPSNFEISDVLIVLCRKIEGVIHDCVNGGVTVR
ncbi:hypothetical protein P3W55_25790 [Pseudomonas citronellolis]|uniref:Phage tail protein n=1 Tax=Pseudomonas citronellolis TaxID=53408 RepID=A0AAW6PB55_9PSED|nr:hypothetical protein [Pseudomonas citronellolis]MDF3845136.1 hypothetical protein [Pseudomonas citronellolis]